MKKEKYIDVRDGKYRSYRVRVNGHTKTFSEDKYPNALKLAINYRNKVLAGMIDEKPVVILTLSDVFEEMFDFYVLRSETERKHRLTFRKYMSSVANIPITDLKRADVIETLNKMVNTCSDRTISRTLSLFRKIVYMSIAKEYIDKDCTMGIIPPKSHKIVTPKAICIMDKQILSEVATLCGTKIMNVYDRQMFPLLLWSLYYTGMRPAELFALEKKDVNNGVISITKELGSDRVKEHVIRTCKNHQSIREIPIADELSPYLILAKKLCKGNLLFGNRYGNYYNVTNVGDRIHKLCGKHNIQFNLYAIRHNFSTQLINNGIDPRTHQELMGHKNYTMSVNYARSTNEQKKAALKTL